MYTIEDRRSNMEGVQLNEYEKYVIENFDTLNPQMTLDSKLKAPVLDGMLKIKKFEVTIIWLVIREGDAYNIDEGERGIDSK